MSGHVPSLPERFDAPACHKAIARSLRKGTSPYEHRRIRKDELPTHVMAGRKSAVDRIGGRRRRRHVVTRCRNEAPQQALWRYGDRTPQPHAFLSCRQAISSAEDRPFRKPASARSPPRCPQKRTHRNMRRAYGKGFWSGKSGLSSCGVAPCAWAACDLSGPSTRTTAFSLWRRAYSSGSSLARRFSRHL